MCKINTKKTLPLWLGLFFVFIFSLSLVMSCNKTSVAVSFAGTVDTIDECIASGQIKEANNLLKKLSRSASSVTEFFSVYKRYVRLGDVNNAGKIVKKAYLKHADQAEVVAVYAHYLLNQNKLDTAEKIATRLEGTQYGSLLTEIRLRKASDNQDYLKHEFIQAFCDAANATGNEAYLRNAAVIEAYNGFIKNADALHPKTSFYNSNKLFWAMIAFDAGNFTQTYIDLSSMEETPEVLLLQADAALYLDEQKAAFNLWQKVQQIAPDFSAVPYYNIAHYGNLNNDQVLRGTNLINLVSLFPDYMPGIASYGNYAYDSVFRKAEDSITEAVRKAGFKSLRMVAEDAMPIVPVEDALKRMDDLLFKTNDSQLLVERLKLQWRASQKSSEEKLIDVWFNLEANPQNETLHQYGVWLLCVLKRYDEATRLFDGFLTKKYGSAVYVDLTKEFSAWEAEYAAFLHGMSAENAQIAQNQNASNAGYALCKDLYDALVQKDTRAVPVLLNYGSICFAQNEHQKALDLYTNATKLTADETLKAEIQYRIAKVYVAKHDVKTAQMCLSYCLQLNPDHPKARLLYKQLEYY